MTKFIGIICGAILLAGCASHKSPSPPPNQAKSSAKPVLTPDFRFVGRVASVNLDGRFVIIAFSPGQTPKADVRFNIYHNGLKTAEVTVDGSHQNDTDTVADIVQGEVQVGDEGRQD
jgi:PBP1b-binding outer membrane lipoprotein LpoB